jgi:polar amino acid transport system substrate-binding protein
MKTTKLVLPMGVMALAAMAALTAVMPLAATAQTVRAVTEASAYVYLEDGKVAGPATELLERSLKNAGLPDYKVGINPWARAYDMALSEPNVLIYLIARTAEREKQFQWVGEFMQVRYFLYKLRQRGDVSAPTLDAARQYTIGVMRDDARHQYLKKQGFGRLVVSARVSENFLQLVNRQVDLVPLSEAGAANQCAGASFDCANIEKVLALEEINTGLYMAFSNSTAPEVVARTQAAFEALRANGTVRRVMDAKPPAPRTHSPPAR